jgi:cobalt-zinc-cadmium efflux system membrane fusion protein
MEMGCITTDRRGTKSGALVRRKPMQLARLWIVIGMCCGALAVVGCERTEEHAAASAPTPAVAPPNAALIVLPPDSSQVQQLRVQPVDMVQVPTDEVTAPAKVVLNPNRIARVALPVPGRVTRLLVMLGDAVTQGQPLLTIDSPDAHAAIAAVLQAEATERQAKATLAKAHKDLDRTTRLFEAGAGAKKDVIAAENDHTQAQEALAQAQAMRQQALHKLTLLGLQPSDFGQQIVVRAPFAGKVIEISVGPGDYRSDTSVPLMTIADLSKVWVSADVPEPSLRFVGLGEPVDIEFVAYPGETFHGRVMRVADTLDPQARTLKVHVELANSNGRLRPEMFGRLRHPGALHTLPGLPTAAVVQAYGRSMVFVEQAPGQFERREVVLGARRDDMVPVLSGLSAGERVVVDGAMLLKDR